MATASELRNNLRGEPGVSPEDTRTELLAAKEAEKAERKADEADSMLADRIAIASTWTDSQAKTRASQDAAQHAEFLARGARGDSDAFYLRSDMATQAKASDSYDAALKASAPELHTRVLDNESENVVVDVAARLAAAQDQKATVDSGLKAQLDDDLVQRKARERELAAQGLNAVNVQRSGKELDRGDFIMPRQITQSYTEVQGKFFAKDTNRVMFEDKGEKIATSTTDKAAIADMVAYAKAKQWSSLKLSGSQEFRREAWLQAESQGIKTQGYTPKQSDLAALETLRQERATNNITPLQERKASRSSGHGEEATAAPRHDLNKNQAAMHVEANKSIATNMQALQKNPGTSDKSVDELAKLAYWRGIVAEENKLQSAPVKAEALARFDKLASDPQFLKRLDDQTGPKFEDKTTERVQQRETHEQTL